MIKTAHISFAIAGAMAVCSLFGAVHAAAAEITIFASGAIRGPLSELAPQFERASGNKVTADYSIAENLRRRISAGEAFDIAILGPAQIDGLIQQKKISADTRIAFGRSGLGVGVPKGLPKPDISSLEAFKRTLLNAKAIAYEPEAQTGPLFLDVLNALQIAQSLGSKLRGYKAGEFNPALQRHEAEIAISSVPALMANPVADLVGGFPTGVQRYVSFVGGISADAKALEAAKAFLRFLTSPNAEPAFKKHGFERG